MNIFIIEIQISMLPIPFHSFLVYFYRSCPKNLPAHGQLFTNFACELKYHGEVKPMEKHDEKLVYITFATSAPFIVCSVSSFHIISVAYNLKKVNYLILSSS